MADTSYMARKSVADIVGSADAEGHSLSKALGATSITAMGIGAIIGAGIFVLTGTAAAQFAGPSIILSFVLGGIACAFVGLCYSELAAMLPVCGSSYTYTYATLGEIFAWIIGWDLILEYAFSNMSVSVGFAAHFVDLLDWLGIPLSPKWLSPAYLPQGLQDLAGNYVYQPGWHFGFNIPAFLIVILLTVVLVRGIRESARTNNIMVLIKIVAILAFIGVGLHFIHPSYYHPFSPNGWAGVLAGGSIIFFTYIGFDSVSTASEECKDAQRTVPIGIIATLIVCTILYIGVSLVLTGIVPWQSVIGDAAPVVNGLKRLTLSTHSSLLHWTRLIVLLGAIIGMISSILVFQLGQARVWFAMSRDRLLPDIFSHVHPRFRTPAFATWVAGILVAIPSGLFDVGTLAELSNIGTLFAFVLVSIGVIVLRRRQPERHRGFRVPGGPVFPVLSVLFCILLMAGLPARTWERFFIWLIIGLFVYFLYSRKRSEFYRA